jgi:Ca-activated chloride channel homolog
MSMQTKKKQRPSLLARIVGGVSLGSAFAALVAVWLLTSNQLTAALRPILWLSLSGALGLVLGAWLLKFPWLALRGFLCAAATIGLGYTFYHFLLQPQLETISFEAYGKDIEILAPRWIGLACVVPYFWLIDGFTLADFPQAQRVFSAIWRSLIVIALAMSLTKAHFVVTDQKICTVVVVDVSDSMPDAALLKAREYLAQVIEAQRKDDMVRLVLFASHPEVIELTSETLALKGNALREKLPEIKRPEPPKAPEKGQPATQPTTPAEGAGTDIQAALRLAYGLYPPGFLKRAVLISDGNQTEGDVLAEAYEANSLGVKIFAKTFPEAFPEEMLIKSISVPERVQQGAPFDLKIEVYASKAGKAKLRMCKDSFCDPADVRSLELIAGINEVIYPRQKIVSGSYAKFNIDLNPEGNDTIADNNHAQESVIARSKPNVLYLEGDLSYSSYLRDALSSQNIDVEVRGPNEVPTSMAEMQTFDLVIMSDIDATFVDTTQMSLIESYVRTTGGGFIMTGGDRSFGLGGYYRTPIEKILPADFDTNKEKETPGIAIALVIDKSGSMQGPRIEIAKEAAKAVVDLLAPSDKISVIGFDSEARSIVALQAVRNRIKILSDIGRMEAGGGTNIFPALDKAYGELSGTKAIIKHVILLSDGISSTEGLEALAAAMYSDRITLSTVSVGDGSDRDLMQRMARLGGGRSYFTRDPSSVPKIFTKETSTATQSSVMEGAYQAIPTPKGLSSQALKGIDWGAAPPLFGYVAVKPKSGAEVLLVADPSGDPLLARMSVGLGKTAVFTSDVKSRWAPEWIRWGGYSTFWAQVVRDLMRRKVQERFDLHTEAQGESFKAIVDAVDDGEEFVNGMTSELVLFDPEKPSIKRTFPLYQVAAGRYEGEFKLPSFGSFVIEANHKKEGQSMGQSRATVSQSYPREHLSFDRNATLLSKAAELTGGKPDADAAASFDPKDESVKRFEPLWPYFILAALALFILDVFLRRVRLGRV